MARTVDTSSTLENFRTEHNNLATDVGAIGSLRTGDTTSIVNAVNYLMDQYFFFQDFDFDGQDGATSNTVFSGTDNSGNTLQYAASKVLVYKNGLLLRSGTDYIALNGTSITLNASANNADVIRISSYTGSYTNTPSGTETLFRWNIAGDDVWNINSGGLVFNSGKTIDNIVVSPTVDDSIQFEGPVYHNDPVTVGVDGTGHDVKFFGDTAGSYFLWDQSADALLLTDSTPIKLGDNQDLQIYHDGSNSYIDDTGTGHLYIRGGYLSFGNLSGEVYLSGAENGAVLLNYDNANKLATVTGGINVTGDTDTDTLTVSGNATVGGTLGVTGATTLSSTLGVTGVASFADGSASAPSITNTGDSNTGILFPAGDNIGFTVGGTQKAFLSPSQFNVTGNGIFSGNGTFGGALEVTGEITAASLDISGNTDIDGTLEADAYTVDGTALNEYIADTIGTMVGSNTETNIAVTYEDSDNTLDFVIGTLNQDTTGTAALATSITVSANNSTDETVYPIFVDGATGTQGVESDTGLSYNPSTGIMTATGFNGPVTGAATNALTLTNSRNFSIDGDITASAEAFNGSANVVLTATIDDNVVDASALNVSGNGSADQALLSDGDGSFSWGSSGHTTEELQDIIGDMFSSNTETRIAATYDDTNGKIDLVVDAAAGVTVSDSTANTNFPVVFHNESNELLDDTGALRYNPSTGQLLVPNLTVAGTTTQVNTVTMNATNAIVFEGATADNNETTLTVVDPTIDRTQYLLNATGYIPVLAALTTTSITSTPEELNLLDGSVANTVVNSKAVIYGGSGQVAGTLSTATQNSVTTMTGLTSVGTIGTGTWQGTAINQTYLVGQSGTNTGDQDTVDMGSGFKVRDDDNDDITITENQYMKFVIQDGAAFGTNLTGVGSTGNPYVMTLTSPFEANTDTNTTYTAGTGMTLSGTQFNCDITDTNTTYSAGTGMTLSGTTFNCNITDTNTVTSLRLDNAGTYRTGNINLVGGTNVTISETSAGVFSFASTDTNTDTNTVTRVRETNTTYRSGDLTLVGGTNVTISETSAGVFNFASTDTNTDTNTTYTAGTNMSLSGTEFSATDTNTTYSAGAGLDLSGTTFSIEADVREHANARFGNNATDFILFDSDNDLLRFYINDNEKAQIDAAGNLDVLNDIIAYSTSVSSDEKLKDNIEIIPSALDKLSQVKGVTFNWKKDGKASAGVIAQDVEKVLPSAVSEHKKLNSDEVYKNVDYNQVIGLLVESIKELKSELDDLKSSNS